MQDLTDKMESLKLLSSAKITISEEDLGPEPDELEKIQFIRCMEQYHTVHKVYYYSRVRGWGVPKKRPGKK